MASLYLDNNLSPLLAGELQALGHTAFHARTLGYRHAKDFEHLVFAARLGAILVTHDLHFALLHGAWRFWTATWGIPEHQSGILIIPDQWSYLLAAAELDQFVRGRGTLIDAAYHWQMGSRWNVV